MIYVAYISNLEGKMMFSAKFTNNWEAIDFSRRLVKEGLETNSSDGLVFIGPHLIGGVVLTETTEEDYESLTPCYVLGDKF